MTGIGAPAITLRDGTALPSVVRALVQPVVFNRATTRQAKKMGVVLCFHAMRKKSSVKRMTLQAADMSS